MSNLLRSHSAVWQLSHAHQETSHVSRRYIPAHSRGAKSVTVAGDYLYFLANFIFLDVLSPEQEYSGYLHEQIDR